MNRAVPELDRYAEALLSLGEAAGRASEIERELTALLELFERDEDVRRFLADPTIRKSGKKKAVEQLLEGRICSVLVHFLLILQYEGLLGRLGEIAESFFAKYSSRRQRVNGVLTSAAPVSPDKIATIEEEAGRLLGKEVHLRVEVDSGILGGLRIQVGDLIIDGTVEQALAQARARLLT